MGLTSELQNIVDKELAYLKDFNNSYLDESLDFYLADKESHIKPIIEAIALLSARTQINGRQQIDLLHQRLTKQFMSYLVAPMPAMGLVKIDVETLIEPTTIPAGTTLILNTYDGREAQFNSLFDTPLQAIALRNIGIANKLGENSKLVVQLEALNDYPGKVEKLQLCLYGQGNYQTSVRLKKLLQTDCLSIEGLFNNGTSVSYQIEASDSQSTTDSEAIHPITKERQFFQLPHKNSFITLHTEQDAPKKWKNCQLIFTLNHTWPSSLLLNDDLIKLFVVPIENRRSTQTDPIFYNGTQNQYRILPPSITPTMQLCSIKGVYQIKEGEHIPLHSSVLVDEQNTYEIAYPQEGTDNGRQYPLLMLNMPEAFDTPVKIMTDAYWHEPQFSKAVTQSIRIHPADLDITGVEWRLLNTAAQKFTPYTPPTPLTSSQLLELTALKNKPILTLQELFFITHALSTVWKGEFNVIKSLIDKLEVKHEYQKQRIHPANSTLASATEKPILRYTLSFIEFDPQLIPLVEDFLHHLENILAYWVSHYRIHLVPSYADTFTDQHDNPTGIEDDTEAHYEY